MSTNISCLETFALNIIKNSSPEKIIDDGDTPELDACSLCNHELFLFEIKNPITILVCGHIYHRDCIENYIKKRSICPKPDCKKEVESTINSMPGSQNTNDLMDISPSLFTDPLFQSPSKKRASESVSVRETTTKKIKKADGRKDKDYPMLKKLIEELKSSNSSSSTASQTEYITRPGNFTDLYDAIIKAEERIGSTNQEVIRAYFLFGKKLEEKLAEYIKTNKERKAQRLLTKEVSAQLPSDLSKNAVEKRIERARKIYDLFTTIGEDKIERVKSYSALRISKLSWDEIDAIVEKFES
ncbi:18567_t:CDS:1, partial [Dentiscutata erythropus]